MVSYRHWSVLLWWDPNDVPHRRILPSYEAERWSVPASLCWWCCYCLADQLWVLIAYARRRRIKVCCDKLKFLPMVPKAHGRANVYAHGKSIKPCNSKNALTAFYMGWFVVMHPYSNFTTCRSDGTNTEYENSNREFPDFLCTYYCDFLNNMYS